MCLSSFPLSCSDFTSPPLSLSSHCVCHHLHHYFTSRLLSMSFPLSYFFHVFLIKYINLKPTLQNSVLTQNYMRVAEVWLDEYKDSFYATKPLLEGKPCGNISEQVEYRRQNCPKSFKWFMEEIAFDNLQEYPPPAKNKIWGEVRLYHNRFWDVYILI